MLFIIFFETHRIAILNADTVGCQVNCFLIAFVAKHFRPIIETHPEAVRGGEVCNTILGSIVDPAQNGWRQLVVLLLLN